MRALAFLGLLLGVVAMAEGFTLKSPAFAYGGAVPKRYTCDGEDRSPPLRWQGVPEGTGALLLYVFDPDAPVGTFVHWVAYDLPPDRNGLPEGVPKTPEAMGFKQATNDFRRVGYGGPCPPRGHGSHRYFFRLYALDGPLGLAPGRPAREVLKAAEGHVLGEAEWMGTYTR